MRELGSGQIRKMRVETGSPVQYRMPLDDAELALNPLLGSRLVLRYLGRITCIHCGRKTNKSFSQGYCYPCFRDLAQCDSCIIKPETCHYFEGSCREPDWADQFCMQEHIVYIANSSGLKVGITRRDQVPTRWIDQGAVQARPLIRVKTRQQSGFVEVELGGSLADKTNWRTMLRGQQEELDLGAEAARVLAAHDSGLDAIRAQFGIDAITVLDDAETWRFEFPVIEYPSKIVSLNLDKQPEIDGRLLGIKGQYLIFDCGVINIRKYGGYHCLLGVHD